ncbi:UNVERIFIED_CONTAM: hypothetical protein H355_003094 [Colinus virginianus]|nr:hypothetical protein H355_003094 [Colinus virginianus]
MILRHCQSSTENCRNFDEVDGRQRHDQYDQLVSTLIRKLRTFIVVVMKFIHIAKSELLIAFVDMFARPSMGLVANSKFIRPKIQYFFSFAVFYNGPPLGGTGIGVQKSAVEDDG